MVTSKILPDLLFQDSFSVIHFYRNNFTLTANAGDVSIIKIGHDIEITVTEIRGDQVRIGIHAHRNIAIHRREIYDELAAEAQATKVQSLGDHNTIEPQYQ